MILFFEQIFDGFLEVGSRDLQVSLFVKAENLEYFSGGIVKVFGGFAEGFAVSLEQSQDRQRRVRQLDKGMTRRRMLQIVTVFVPPTILHKVQTVFYLPMIADQTLKIGRLDAARIKTANKVTRIMRRRRSVRRKNVAVHANKNLTTGNVQSFTNIIGVDDVAPELAYFNRGPLFSTLRS